MDTQSVVYLSNLGHIYMMEYYLAVKRNILLKYFMTGTKLKSIMLSERSKYWKPHII